MVELVVEPFALRHPDLTFRVLHDDDQVAVRGDFLKLNRVLANLLDNAVRIARPAR